MSSENQIASNPIVQTSHGKVCGTRVLGIATFKGIPYGASTGGSNRFLPPQAPEHWTGVREAFRLGNQSPQLNADLVGFYADESPMSEDCLNLNVWSPADLSAESAEKLPVMVWFHGGAFENGSSGSQAYDCQNLARIGKLVCVSVNHRLNAFGYLYLGKDVDERFASSGNVGQLDLVAALNWVRDNIAQFGGDPHNVTIFGESGGGGKVSALLAMPSARGLFHKAIVQSGSFLKCQDPEQAIAVTKEVYRHLGIPFGDVAALQSVPTSELLDAYCHKSGYVGALEPGQKIELRFLPVVDGKVICRHPWHPSAPTEAAGIPLMIGATSDEAASFAYPDDLNASEFAPGILSRKIAQYAILSDAKAQDFSAIIPHYRDAMPDLDDGQLMVRIATDAGFWRCALSQAEQHLAARHGPVFMFDFAWKTPWQGRPWAMHGVDLAFVFGYPDSQSWAPGDSPEIRASADPDGLRYRLTEQTVSAWSSFAYTGNPSTAALNWPEYNLEKRPTMIFDRHTRVEFDPRGNIRNEICALLSR